MAVRAPTQATRTIDVVAPVISVDFYILDMAGNRIRWAKPGTTIRFRAYVYEDGVGAPNRLVQFKWEEGNVVLGQKYTGSDGRAEMSWTVPWTIDTVEVVGSDWTFGAHDVESGEYATLPFAIAYPTRIRDFSAPSQVAPDEQFTISGYLEYEYSPGSWAGLPNQTVSISYDTTSLGNVTTGVGGYFELSASISTPGTYTLKAIYAGSNLPTAVGGKTAPGIPAPTGITSPIAVRGTEELPFLALSSFAYLFFLSRK